MIEGVLTIELTRQVVFGAADSIDVLKISRIVIVACRKSSRLFAGSIDLFRLIIQRFTYYNFMGETSWLYTGFDAINVTNEPCRINFHACSPINGLLLPNSIEFAGDIFPRARNNEFN